MMAASVVLKDQAMWLAKGYVQGQRDLLVRILEHRFSESLSASVRRQIADAPPYIIEMLGPLVLTAPDIDAVLEAAELLAADG